MYYLWLIVKIVDRGLNVSVIIGSQKAFAVGLVDDPKQYSFESSKAMV